MRILILILAACSSAPHQQQQPPADAARWIDGGDAPDGPTGMQSACFPTGPQPGHDSVTCGNIVFDIDVPASCVIGGCGVIVDVHGMTMSAAMEEANTELRMRGTAAGFIVIQPNANPAPPQASWSTSDDPTIYDFLTQTLAVYQVDMRRIHFTGFSQGGFMTWRFLCDHADMFASVAPAAASTNGGFQACSFTGSEVPSRQLPVLYMHGRNDDHYASFSWAQPQVDAIVSAWGLSSDGVIASDSTFTRTRWSNASGGSLEFLVHDYTSSAEVVGISSTRLDGHCYPGSTDPGGAPGQLFSFKCDQTASFTWGAEVVAFFVAHPKS
jgi:polyhydroxybutyrate depolymerase